MSRHALIAIAAALTTAVCYAQTAVPQPSGHLPFTIYHVQPEAQQSLIKTITIQGNEHVSKEAVLAALRTKLGSAYLDANPDQDRAALEGLGFFDKVSVRLVPLDDHNWNLVVELREYPVVKEIRIKGNRAVKTPDLLKLIDLPTGKPFNDRSALTAAKAIDGLYQSRGFFCSIEEFGPVAAEPGVIQVSILEMTVGHIGVAGNIKTRDDVFRRILRTRQGEPYNAPKWHEDLQRVFATKWFHSVYDVTAMPAPGQHDLKIEVEEAKTGSYAAGLQAAPEIGGIAGTFKIGDTNFRGSGRSLGFEYVQSPRGGGPSADLKYGDPFVGALSTALQVSVYSHLEYRFSTGLGGGGSPAAGTTYFERHTGASLGVGRVISPAVTASVTTRIEQTDTSNLSTTNPNGAIVQDGQVASVAMTVTRDRRNKDDNASKGDWLQAEVQPGVANITNVGGALQDPTLIGQHAYAKGSVEYRGYMTRGERKPVFAIRARYGAITGTVPFFEQYFAGGTNSIRGYADDRFWGKQLLITSAEYRIPVTRDLHVVAFSDYGGAWGGYGSVSTFGQTAGPNLKLGYGLGLGYKTDLGLLRLDFGLNDRGVGRLHFMIGSAF